MQPLSAGSLAPDFSLSDQDGNQVRLADLRGKKVLVYFYPKAMTPAAPPSLRPARRQRRTGRPQCGGARHQPG